MSEVQFSKKKLLELAMKAYSLDLRQKIIDVYLKEEISQRQYAKRFRVATSFIIKLLNPHFSQRYFERLEPLSSQIQAGQGFQQCVVFSSPI